MNLDKIQDLSNKGLTPTWYLQEAWAEITYGTNDPQSTAKPTQQDAANATSQPHRLANENESEMITLLKDRIEQLESDKQQRIDEHR